MLCFFSRIFCYIFPVEPKPARAAGVVTPPVTADKLLRKRSEKKRDFIESEDETEMMDDDLDADFVPSENEEQNTEEEDEEEEIDQDEINYLKPAKGGKGKSSKTTRITKEKGKKGKKKEKIIDDGDFCRL